MKKQSARKSDFTFLRTPLRALCAAAMLCCAAPAALAAAPAPTPAQQNQAGAGDDAALNFVGADIESVIKAVGHYTNITFVIDPRVKGTLTVVSEKAVSKSQAFALLTSALRLQGYAVVSGDGYAKVVPEADAKLQSSPTLVAGAKLKGDQVATQVFHLSYENSANLVTVLRPLISPNNTINANPGNNSLVITDYADNLQRLGKIIAALDAPSNADLDVIPVRYAIATDLAAIVNKLLDASGSSGGGAAPAGGENRISVLADPRTNEVIVRAPSPARANLAKSLIAKLDQPTTERGNIHVVYLKNADATKLAQTLRQVVSFDTSSPQSQPGTSATGSGGATGSNTGSSTPSTSSSTTGSAGSTGSTNPALSNSGQQQGPGGSSGNGGAAGYIQADSSTNTLIITAPEPIYRNLRAVIDQLDVRRAQVYIEALVVEVNSDKLGQLGVQWAGLSGDSTSGYRVGSLTSFSNAGANNLVTLATGVAAGTAAPGAGLSLGIFKQTDGKLGLGAVLSALQQETTANILSTPNLITLDNELATIVVGQDVPILTGQFTSTAGTNTNPFQTIDRKEVGLTLKVRPQISEGGTIKMAIYHETSSVDQTTLTAAAGVTINKRVIENNVVADDGQIIVLGGLISDTVNGSNQGVPGLSDLPWIGGLFKYRTSERVKNNLMVFLRPVVVRSREQSTLLAADRYDYMRGQEAGTEAHTDSPLLRDLGTPVLSNLANGVPIGGDNTVKPLPPTPPRQGRIEIDESGPVINLSRQPLPQQQMPQQMPPQLPQQ
jgi:general secretion pathway protein D